MTISPYFRRDEFACNCGCGFDTVDIRTLSVLESIRDHFGPVYITSGCRCSDYNAQVGGVPDSQHVHARAADIQVEGASPDAVYGYVVNNLPGVSAGRYDTFTHVDTRTNGPARWDARS